LQGLSALLDKIIAFKLTLTVPADHARHEYHAASRFDAIGIAFGGGPSGGLQDIEHGVTFLNSSGAA
jgi:hypothetical protein